MISPGIKSLGDFTITAAGTQVGDAVDGLEGMSECDVQIRFQYGAGGSGLKVYIQDSGDQGTTWRDLWCFTATTASKTRARRLKPDGNEMTPTDGALGDDQVASGLVLGDMLRAKIISTGTYSGSTLVSIRATAR
jgi:hypothetical protein